MKNKEDRRFILAISPLIALLCFFCGTLLYSIWDYGQPAEEIETYTESYEISNMEISRGRCYIAARNDTNSFTIKVNRETFAKYTEGEIVEVEIRILEKNEKIFNEYTILGLDK